MNTNDTSQVYVDLNALEDWAKTITTLNSEALEIIKKFEITIDDLDNYYKGNFATGFIDNSTKLTKKAKKIHNSMNDVPIILKNIINAKDQA